MTRLPRAELEGAGDQDDHTGRDRHGARQRRLLHLNRRQRNAQRKSGHSEHGPDDEVSRAYERGQPTEACLARLASGLTAARQLGDPETAASSPPSSRPTFRGTTARRRATSVRASASRSSTSSSHEHRHVVHGRHGRAPDDRRHRAGGEEQRGDAKKFHNDFLIRASCSARYSAIRPRSASASARRRTAASRSRQ